MRVRGGNAVRRVNGEMDLRPNCSRIALHGRQLRVRFTPFQFGNRRLSGAHGVRNLALSLAGRFPELTQCFYKSGPGGGILKSSRESGVLQVAPKIYFFGIVIRVAHYSIPSNIGYGRYYGSL